jgi:hypothetical protein
MYIEKEQETDLLLSVAELEDLPGIGVGDVPGLCLAVQVLHQPRAVTFLGPETFSTL